MHFSELPRDDNGFVHGRYRLRHHNRAFSHEVAGTSFVHGETTSPVDGQTAARLLAAFGNDVEAFPCDDDTETREESERAAAPSTPTTWAELESLDEDQLREIAADLGSTDRRWKAQKLRVFIADELGIEGEGA